MHASISYIPIRLIIECLGQAEGELIRFLSPRTVDSIVKRLPLEGRAALSNNEVYFQVPLFMGEEKAKRVVEKGRLAYWPMGQAFCIFYDKTKPYSAVNYIGNITNNIELFKNTKSGTKLRVEARTGI